MLLHLSNLDRDSGIGLYNGRNFIGFQNISIYNDQGELLNRGCLCTYVVSFVGRKITLPFVARLA